MYVVGIDLGYEFCGLASIDAETLRLWNYMQIETPRTPDLAERLHLVHDALKEQLRFAPTIKAVGYQNFLRTLDGKAKKANAYSSVMILHRVLGHLEAICWERSICLESVEPQEVKKMLTGSGTGSVKDVHRAASAYAGRSVRPMTEFEANATATALTLAHRLQRTARAHRLNA